MRAFSLILALSCGGVTQAQAAAQHTSPMTTADAQLIDACSSRTDARMDTMTLGKLDQIRNYEFSLRMAIAQFAGGAGALTPVELLSATDSLDHARQRYALVCEIQMPMRG